MPSYSDSDGDCEIIEQPNEIIDLDDEDSCHAIQLNESKTGKSKSNNKSKLNTTKLNRKESNPKRASISIGTENPCSNVTKNVNVSKTETKMESVENIPLFYEDKIPSVNTQPVPLYEVRQDLVKQDVKQDSDLDKSVTIIAKNISLNETTRPSQNIEPKCIDNAVQPDPHAGEVLNISSSITDLGELILHSP